MSYADHNRRAWDELVRKRERHTKPARDEDLGDPAASVVDDPWLPNDLTGKRVLCLAAGGGRQARRTRPRARR